MGSFLAASLFLMALMVSGCSSGEGPLEIKVYRTYIAAQVQDATPAVMSVEVELENRGKEAIHLDYGSVQLITLEGERQSLRVFLQALKQRKKGASSSDQEALFRVLEKVGVDQQQLQALAEDVVEIPPGHRIKRIFPFSLHTKTTQGTLELRYHDMASDRVFHLRKKIYLQG